MESINKIQYLLSVFLSCEICDMNTNHESPGRLSRLVLGSHPLCPAYIDSFTGAVSDSQNKDSGGFLDSVDHNASNHLPWY